MTIPVYLFLGFLEGGKTQFIQESMSDKRFHDGDRTLIVVCEEGIEEFDTSKFHGGNVTIAVIEDEAELNAKHLEELRKKCRAERVLIEYNGMWLIQQLAEALPKNWQIYQTMMMLDATTFDIYNANMRQLMIDKFSAAEMIAINRCDPGVDKAKFHNAVRALNRRASIVFEYKDGSIEPDDIKDELPFDLKAPIVEIKDEDFGILYLDAMDEPDKYDGKVISYTGIIAKSPKLPKNTFIAGRFCMTCCAEDINYIGLSAAQILTSSLKIKVGIRLKLRLRLRIIRLIKVLVLFYIFLQLNRAKNLTKSLFTSPKERFRYDMRRYAALTMVSV